MLKKIGIFCDIGWAKKRIFIKNYNVVFSAKISSGHKK